MERLSNNLIKFLVRHTNVHCDTLASMLWKFSESETIAYAKKITEARVKCGHFTEEAYRDWYYENEYERDKARWEAMIKEWKNLKRVDKLNPLWDNNSVKERGIKKWKKDI